MVEGVLFVDTLVSWPGSKLAIEVDAPKHYLRCSAGAAKPVLATPRRIRRHLLR
jgi:hypothetical protein